MDEQAVKRAATIKRIDQLAADWDSVIYTDGSASQGRLNEGAAAVITIRTAESSHVITKLMERGRALTCSTEEEVCALELAAN